MDVLSAAYSRFGASSVCELEQLKNLLVEHFSLPQDLQGGLLLRKEENTRWRTWERPTVRVFSPSLSPSVLKILSTRRDLPVFTTPSRPPTIRCCSDFI